MWAAKAVAVLLSSHGIPGSGCSAERGIHHGSVLVSLDSVGTWKLEPVSPDSIGTGKATLSAIHDMNRGAE